MKFLFSLLLLPAFAHAQFEGAQPGETATPGHEWELLKDLDKILAIDPDARNLVSGGTQFRAQMPFIAPDARDLLARLNARYKNYKTFSALVELRVSQPMPWTYNRLRVQMDRFRARVVAAEPGRGTLTEIFDGRTVLQTNTQFPRAYSTQKIDAERYSLRVFLKNSGADMIGLGLLTNRDLGEVLLDPDLVSVALGETKNEKGLMLQSVEFRRSGKFGDASMTLWIDPKTLILHRVEGTDNTPRTDKKSFSFSETYSEILFDAPLSASLFQTQPPQGFRPVESVKEGWGGPAPIGETNPPLR